MRSNTIPTAALIAATLLLGGLVDCRCPEKQPATKAKPDATRSAVHTKPVYKFPSNTLRRQMRRLNKVTEELRREVTKDYVYAAMVGAALKIQNEMSTGPGTPKVFITELAAMKQATKLLQAKKQLRQDYTHYINRCVSCHRKLAKDYIDIVAELYLDEKKKTP